MIKWLWYSNAVIIFGMVLMLIIGLSLLPENPARAETGDGGSASEAGGNKAGKTDGAGQDQEDSSLVAAARLFVKRWEPKVPKRPALPKLPSIPKTPSKPKPPKKEYGSLMVSVKPAEAAEAKAKWRVGQGAWQDSGATMKEIEVGTRKVSFQALKDWEIPKEITVDIIKDQVATAWGTYKKTKPPGPKFSLEGTLTIGEFQGQAWVKLPKEKKAKPYRVGEVIGKYKIVRVGNGVVELVRDGYEYSIEVPKPKTKEISNSKANKVPGDVPGSIRDVDSRRRRSRRTKPKSNRDRI